MSAKNETLRMLLIASFSSKTGMSTASIAHILKAGEQLERDLILEIIQTADWSGEDLAEDIRNLTRMIEESS